MVRLKTMKLSNCLSRLDYERGRYKTDRDKTDRNKTNRDKTGRRKIDMRQEMEQAYGTEKIRTQIFSM